MSAAASLSTGEHCQNRKYGICRWLMSVRPLLTSFLFWLVAKKLPFCQVSCMSGVLSTQNWKLPIDGGHFGWIGKRRLHIISHRRMWVVTKAAQSQITIWPTALVHPYRSAMHCFRLVSAITARHVLSPQPFCVIRRLNNAKNHLIRDCDIVKGRRHYGTAGSLLLFLAVPPSLWCNSL